MSPFTARLAALFVAVFVAACGGSHDDSDTRSATATDAPPAALAAPGAIGSHLAALGPLSGATVTIAPVLQPDRIVASSSTDASGRFKLTVPDEFLDTLMLVEVSGGLDTDANDDGVTGDTAPNAGSIKALVLGRQLRESSIAVTILSDVLARAVSELTDVLPDEEVLDELDDLAYDMVKADMNGDGVIDYLDILHFVPNRAEYRARLEIDYLNLVHTPLGSGRKTLAQSYHAKAASLSNDVATRFDGFVSVDLPPTEQLGLHTAVIYAGAGGQVTSPQVPGLNLALEENEYTLRLSSGKPEVDVVATPDAGYAFVRWAGCESVKSANVCTIRPGSNQIVRAQFRPAANVLEAGFLGPLDLSKAAPGELSVTLAADLLTITAKTGSTWATALQAVQAQWIVHTGLVKHPVMLVSERLASPAQGPVSDLVQVKLKVQSIDPMRAYSSLSIVEPDRPMNIDDVSRIRVSTVSGQDKVLAPRSVANSDTYQGPKSSQTNPQSCPEGLDPDLGVAVNGDPTVVYEFCIERNAPIAPAECPAGEELVEILDGRRFCVSASELAGAQAMVDGKRAALGLTIGAAPQGSPSGNMKLATATAPSRYSTVSPNLRRAQAAGQVTPAQPASVLWLLGYGKAFDLGDGVYLVNNPERSGLMMIELDAPAAPVRDRQAAFKSACQAKSSSPECAYLRRSTGLAQPQWAVFPTPITFNFPIKNGMVTVRAQLELDFVSRSNFQWVKPLRVEFASTGALTITPRLGLDLALQWEKEKVLQAGGARASGRGGLIADSPDTAKIYQKIYAMEFGRTASGGAATSELELGVGVDILGEVKLETNAVVQTALLWDADMRGGWGCRQSLLRDCTSDSHFEVKVKPKFNYEFGIKGSVNAVVEPYVQLGWYSGVTGVAERLVNVKGRVFLQGELTANGSYTYSTLPATVAAWGGSNHCFAGEVGANVYFGGRLTAEFSTRDAGLLNSVYSATKEWVVFEHKQKLFSAGWAWDANLNRTEAAKSVFASGEKKIEQERINLSGIATPSCEGKSKTNKDAESELSFDAGNFQLSVGQFAMTNNRTFEYQMDGNVVLYGFPKAGGEFNYDRDRRVALWASDTRSPYGRLIFQADGNLVLYDAFDKAVWSTSTHNRGRTLKFQADGNMVVYDRDGKAVWSADAHGKNL